MLLALSLFALGVRWSSADDVRLPGWAILFVGWCASSVLWSEHPDQTVVGVATLALVTASAMTAASTFSARSMIRGIIIGSVLAAALSLVFVVLYPGQALVADPGELGALQGIYAQRNILAYVLAIGLVTTACAGWAIGRRTAVRLVVSVFLALCLVAAQSTTALVSAVIGLSAALGFVGIRRAQKHRRTLLAISLFSGAAAVGTLVLGDLGTVLGSFGEDRSLTGRTEIWSAVWTRIAEAPWAGHGWAAVWGAGDDSGDFIRQYIGYFINHSHDSSLDVLIQVGVVGLALVVACLIQLTVASTRQYYGDASPLGVWPLAMLTTFVTYSVSESKLTEPLGWFLVVVLMVLLAKNADTTVPGRRPRSGP
ncbi:MAG: O-antigen ligase family protein [Pseudonocardia sp.]|nr:O-antigen ligase family protein [Pseudonocardia sp.]